MTKADTKSAYSSALTDDLATAVAKQVALKPTVGQLTAPGLALNAQLEAQQLKRRIQELEQLAAGGETGVLLDPKDVRLSKWANRNEMAYQTDSFKQLKTKIAHTNGNVQAIGVTKNEQGQWIVVFGHRRLRACRELNLKVRAVVLEGTVSEDMLLVAMHNENDSQLPPSVWEQGLWFKKMLDEGKFKSQRELAESLGVTHTWVGVAIDAAKTPAEVVNCWPNPVEIPTPAFKALKKALEQDADSVLLRAAVIRDRDEPLKASEVLKHLLHDDGEGPEEKPRKLAIGKAKPFASVRKDGQARTIITLDPAFRRDDVQLLLKLAQELASSKPALTQEEKPKAKPKAKAKKSDAASAAPQDKAQ